MESELAVMASRVSCKSEVASDSRAIPRGLCGRLQIKLHVWTEVLRGKLTCRFSRAVQSGHEIHDISTTSAILMVFACVCPVLTKF